MKTKVVVLQLFEKCEEVYRRGFVADRFNYERAVQHAISSLLTRKDDKVRVKVSHLDVELPYPVSPSKIESYAAMNLYDLIRESRGYKFIAICCPKNNSDQIYHRMACTELACEDFFKEMRNHIKSPIIGTFCKMSRGVTEKQYIESFKRKIENNFAA